MYTCTGWCILIGCLHLRVIFRKRATNYEALLRKMTYEDKASYDFTPPCNDSTAGKVNGRGKAYIYIIQYICAYIIMFIYAYYM